MTQVRFTTTEKGIIKGMIYQLLADVPEEERIALVGKTLLKKIEEWK